MERTRFDEWLEAVGQTARGFATEHRMAPFTVYYLAGIRSTREVKGIGIAVLARVSAATGIKPEVLLRDAMLVKPRAPDGKPGPRRAG